MELLLTLTYVMVRFHPDDLFIDPPTHWEYGTVDLSPHEEFFSPSGENDQVIEQPYDRLLSSFGVPPTSNALRGWGEWNRSSYGPAVSQPVIQRPPVTTYHGPAAPNRNVSSRLKPSRNSTAAIAVLIPVTSALPVKKLTRVE